MGPPFAGVTLFALGALQAGVPLGTLYALRALFARIAFFALWTLWTCVALGAGRYTEGNKFAAVGIRNRCRGRGAGGKHGYLCGKVTKAHGRFFPLGFRQNAGGFSLCRFSHKLSKAICGVFKLICKGTKEGILGGGLYGILVYYGFAA